MVNTTHLPVNGKHCTGLSADENEMANDYGIWAPCPWIGAPAAESGDEPHTLCGAPWCHPCLVWGESPKLRADGHALFHGAAPARSAVCNMCCFVRANSSYTSASAHRTAYCMR